MEKYEDQYIENDVITQILFTSVFSEDSFDVIDNYSNLDDSSNTIKHASNAIEVINELNDSDAFSFLIISANLIVMYFKLLYACIVLGLVSNASWVLIVLSTLVAYVYSQLKVFRKIRLSLPNGLAVCLSCITVAIHMLAYANTYFWVNMLIVLIVVACAAFVVYVGNEVNRIGATWPKKCHKCCDDSGVP